jgi:hypothetical protein
VLPSTLSGEVGEEISFEVVPDEKAKSIYQPVDAKAGQDVDSVSRIYAPGATHWGQIKLRVTGPNPILQFVLEQVELPDLEAKLSLNMRRYTEREQVFCDVTGLAIVRNIGQGPAGPVLEAVNLNLSKSNVNRWGLDPNGGQMIVPVADLRLRPGIYQYEISAQLKAGKEKDTKNNEARQAITCR